LVTITTVGYGDIAPSTGEGRAIAALLMVIGIMTVGMLSGSITTYFVTRRGSKNPLVEHLTEGLARWDELDLGQRRELAAMLNALAKAQEHEEPAEGD
jgi:voltage-gated potassium channel